MAVERRRLGAVLAQGVLAGALYGFLQGVDEGSLATGVTWGLVFALVFTVSSYFARGGGEHLAGLSYQQKRAVVSAVRRGDAIGDSALAEPTIHEAQRVQASVVRQRSAVVLARCLLAASVLGLGLVLALGSTAGAAAAGFSLVVWVVILLVGPPLERRRAENALAAEAAARRTPPVA